MLFYTIVAIDDIYNYRGVYNTPQEAWDRAKTMLVENSLPRKFTLLALENDTVRILTKQEWNSIKVRYLGLELLCSVAKESEKVNPNPHGILQAKKYGLRVIGRSEPLLCTLTANKQGFILCELGHSGSVIWTISSIKEAYMAIHNPSGKSFSSYERPWHQFHPGDLEIVEISMKLNTVNSCMTTYTVHRYPFNYGSFSKPVDAWSHGLKLMIEGVIDANWNLRASDSKGLRVLTLEEWDMVIRISHVESLVHP